MWRCRVTHRSQLGCCSVCRFASGRASVTREFPGGLHPFFPDPNQACCGEFFSLPGGWRASVTGRALLVGGARPRPDDNPHGAEASRSRHGGSQHQVHAGLARSGSVIIAPKLPLAYDYTVVPTRQPKWLESAASRTGSRRNTAAAMAAAAESCSGAMGQSAHLQRPAAAAGETPRAPSPSFAHTPPVPHLPS
jgi:hypothetical protein